ncbi:Porin [Liberibacter crescens BT-1]|uniref:Porin n=1 Tax=Liberibacter crescens (strain BT-1) TaxID=1215343 RepID=L0EVT6_LIBCB|nr:porin [Liberibacter crescens]AGA65052.1 Porin [Liberibacter crescens BT-1]AMC13049.1 hypothetical protein RL73_05395 [Liberibacter crescens]
MKIKNVLLSSVACLLAVSSAKAADAVKAEPETAEGVRVCEAFGSGYFYLPGSETCFKIGGYLRFEGDYGKNQYGTAGNLRSWDAFARAQVDLNAKTDTELGDLSSLISLRADGRNSTSRSVFLNQGYLSLSGFKVGYFRGWWDDDIVGETDTLANDETRLVSASYTYNAGLFGAGISLDGLGRYGNKDIGVGGKLSAAFGPVKANVIAGYDGGTKKAAVRGIVSSEVGPGTLEVAAVFANGMNYYYGVSRASLAVGYQLHVTDKFKITPGFQYFWGLGKYSAYADSAGAPVKVSLNTWRSGLAFDYEIIKNLDALLSVQFQPKFIESTGKVAKNQVTGFIRLQRTF